MTLSVQVVPDFGSPLEHMEMPLPGCIQSPVPYPYDTEQLGDS